MIKLSTDKMIELPIKDQTFAGNKSLEYNSQSFVALYLYTSYGCRLNNPTNISHQNLQIRNEKKKQKRKEARQNTASSLLIISFFGGNVYKGPTKPACF